MLCVTCCEIVCEMLCRRVVCEMLCWRVVCGVEGRKEGRKEVQQKEQEPHTTMWGIILSLTKGKLRVESLSHLI